MAVGNLNNIYISISQGHAGANTHRQEKNIYEWSEHENIIKLEMEVKEKLQRKMTIK